MKTVPFVFFAVFFASFPAISAEQVSVSLDGEVVSVEPIVRQGRVSRRDCWEEPVGMMPSDIQSSERSYGGAVLGAIVGGLAGNQVGGGSGKKWATAAGAATGAIVGDNIDNDGHRRYGTQERRQVVVRCPEPESQVVGYGVTVRFPGNQTISHQMGANEVPPEIGEIIPFTLRGVPARRVRHTYR